MIPAIGLLIILFWWYSCDITSNQTYQTSNNDFHIKITLHVLKFQHLLALVYTDCVRVYTLQDENMYTQNLI